MKVGYLVYYSTTYPYEVRQTTKSFLRLTLRYHPLHLLRTAMDVECVPCKRKINSIYLGAWMEICMSPVPHKCVRL